MSDFPSPENIVISIPIEDLTLNSDLLSFTLITARKQLKISIQLYIHQDDLLFFIVEEHHCLGDNIIGRIDNGASAGLI